MLCFRQTCDYKHSSGPVKHKAQNKPDDTMKNYLLFLTCLTLPFTVQAEKGQSIMFGDQDPLYSSSAATDPDRERADHCSELRKQMDELKGSPQKRNAVVRQYELECQQHQSDEILMHKGTGGLF
jgi:hypothetical protein